MNMLGSWKEDSLRYKTNEAFPATKTNPADFDEIEGYSPKRPKVRDDRSGRTRLTRGQADDAWGMYKSNPSQVS